jgi:hypothetical protein
LIAKPKLIGNCKFNLTEKIKISKDTSTCVVQATDVVHFSLDPSSFSTSTKSIKKPEDNNNNINTNNTNNNNNEQTQPSGLSPRSVTMIVRLNHSCYVVKYVVM